MRALLIEILKLCWQNRTAEAEELRDRSECRLLYYLCPCREGEQITKVGSTVTLLTPEKILF